MFSRGPTVAPENVDTTTNLRCDKSVLWPVLDSIDVAGNAVYMAMAASGSGVYAEDVPPETRDIAVGVHVAGMALYGASAIYGYYVADECQRAHERQEQLRKAEESSEVPLAPVRIVPSPPPAPEPVELALGASREEAAATCRRAGHEWSEGEGVLRCSGAPFAGLPAGASAELEFVEDRLSAVEFIVRPPADAQGWASALREAEIALIRRYGKPQQRSFAVPDECKAAELFLGCVADGKVTGSASWSLADGRSVTLAIAAAPPPPTIRVRLTAD
ncbi:hypothetical protein BE04_46845 [Sorangium cellulosum]|uniref:Uncharacterized protein n=1 Tax=Sorangium cellulosum TaxID=56 RepID=A0A150PX11_SORCE|nr:hypothetical protein BE04_46845 [Sorangium cellulosum]